MPKPNETPEDFQSLSLEDWEDHLAQFTPSRNAPLVHLDEKGNHVEHYLPPQKKDPLADPEKRKNFQQGFEQAVKGFQSGGREGALQATLKHLRTLRPSRSKTPDDQES